VFYGQDYYNEQEQKPIFVFFAHDYPQMQIAVSIAKKAMTITVTAASSLSSIFTALTSSVA